MGIVSMAERCEIDDVLCIASLGKVFSVFVSAEPGLRHKPAPDCYQRGLDLLNAQRRADRKLPLLARECLAIEDPPPGLQPARTPPLSTLRAPPPLSHNKS